MKLRAPTGDVQYVSNYVAAKLPAPDRVALIARLDRVRVISHNFGYGVGDDMDSLLAKHSGT